MQPKTCFFQARKQLRIVYPPIPDLSVKKIVTQLNSTVTINFTIEAFPRPEPRGVTWVRLREDNSSEEEEVGVEGWEEVEEGVEDDWIELNQDVGPDKVGLKWKWTFSDSKEQVLFYC